MTVIDYVRGIVRKPGLEDLNDKELLDQFVKNRSQDAFAEVMRRHGSHVLGWCRHFTANETAAEDLFQTVFLILARKATTVSWKASVLPWLYNVTWKVAKIAREKEIARKSVEEEASKMSEKEGPKPEDALHVKQLQSILHDEISSLPDHYRDVVVLYFFKRVKHEEVAKALGVSIRTVHNWRKDALKLLNARLTRRGVALSTAMLVTAMAQQNASATVSASKISLISRAALDFASGSLPSPSTATALAEAFLNHTVAAKKWTWLVLLLATGVATGGIGFALRAKPAETAQSPVVSPSPQKAAEDDRAAMRRKLEAIKPTILQEINHIIPGSVADLESTELEGNSITLVVKWRTSPLVWLAPVYDLRIQYLIEKRELSLYYRASGNGTNKWIGKDPDRPIYATLGDHGPEWFQRGRDEFQHIRQAFGTLGDTKGPRNSNAVHSTQSH